MINIKLAYLSMILLLLSCSDRVSRKRVDIEWREIFNISRPADFCQIDKDSLNEEYIIAYSYSFAIGGGYSIFKLNSKVDSLASQGLLRSGSGSISYIYTKNSIIGCVQGKFDNNVLNTSLLISRDKGTHWDSIATPVTGLRKFCFSNKFLIIEGSLQGVGQVFSSTDFGKSWTRQSSVTRNYKSFQLLNNEGIPNQVLCVGSTGFNERNSKLLLFRPEDSKIEELLEVQGLDSYFKPISKDIYLHGVVFGDKVNVFSFRNNKMHLENRFRLPESTNKVVNLFIREDLYILTAEDLDSRENALTWISYNKGEQWSPYKQEEGGKLIYSTTGALFMVDLNNRILQGRIK